MFRKRLTVAVLAAVIVVLGTGAAQATLEQDRNQSEQRDGQSRHEGQFLHHVPLVLSTEETRRVAAIVFMMQHLTYMSLANLGVDVVSQDRVGLGGLPIFGGLFNETYDSDDFTEANDVGTVFMAADDKLVVALRNDLKLENLKVIVFNTNNEYQVRGTPTVEQVPPETLAKFGAVPLIHQMLLHTASPEVAGLLGSLKADAEPGPETIRNLGVEVLSQVPTLQQHIIGRAYLGPNDTLMLVVRPASVVGDEKY